MALGLSPLENEEKNGFGEKGDHFYVYSMSIFAAPKGLDSAGNTEKSREHCLPTISATY